MPGGAVPLVRCLDRFVPNTEKEKKKRAPRFDSHPQARNMLTHAVHVHSFPLSWAEGREGGGEIGDLIFPLKRLCSLADRSSGNLAQNALPPPWAHPPTDSLDPGPKEKAKNKPKNPPGKSIFHQKTRARTKGVPAFPPLHFPCSPFSLFPYPENLPPHRFSRSFLVFPGHPHRF